MRFRWKRRTEIRVETEQVAVIRISANSPLTWCPGCSRVVAVVESPAAEVLASLDPQTVQVKKQEE